MKKPKKLCSKIVIWKVLEAQDKNHLLAEEVDNNHHHLIIISIKVQQAKSCISMMTRLDLFHQAKLLIQQNFTKLEKEFCTEVKMAFQCLELLITKNLFHATQVKQRNKHHHKILDFTKTTTTQRECMTTNISNS